MPSAFTEIVVLTLAGVVGGNAAGLAIKEYSLGAIKNTLVGALGGGGGYFLQALIPPTVTATGEPVLDYSLVNQMVTLALVGAAAGSMLTSVLGFVIGEASKSRSR